ncbi:MAG: hypothetical protein C0441_05480 [Comamonadaceae bacterium]|nr:hypothetical protein [Comamonadaceae bacterium]
MCLIALAIGQRPDCPLLLAANRDEYWQRPTLPLAAWQLDNGQTVYGGRDLFAGGTWLGFSAAGRVALLTNVRDGQPEKAARSRGELVTRWLAGPPPRTEPPSPETLGLPVGAAQTLPLGPQAWHDLQALLQQTDPSAYGGFNLVLGDCVSGHWCWLSNRPRRMEREGSEASMLAPAPIPSPNHASHAAEKASASPQQPLDLPPGWCGAALPPGVYGLSNAALDSPWPKLLRLKSALAAALQEPTLALHSAALASTPATLAQACWQTLLLEALLDRCPAPDDQLPATGVPLELERLLSSPFVCMPQHGYGTRSSLIARWLRPSAASSQLDLQEWTHALPESGQEHPAPHPWLLTQSGYSSLCISMWGMPTSS